MHALITIFSLLSFFYGEAYATDADKIFTVVVKKQSTLQKNEIIKNKSSLYCKTELIPSFYFSNDQEKMLLVQLEKIKKESEQNKFLNNCAREESMHVTKGKENFSLCVSNSEAKKMLELLSRACGRSL